MNKTDTLNIEAKTTCSRQNV